MIECIPLEQAQLEFRASEMDVEKELSAGSIAVQRDGQLITVILQGWITEELTEVVQAELRHNLIAAGKACVLYDGLDMNDPSLTLVMLMQSFHASMSDFIVASAIVVPGFRLAFLSRLAFGADASAYRVFYNNRQDALSWLREQIPG